METLEILKSAWLHVVFIGLLFSLVFYFLVIRKFRMLFRADIHPSMKVHPAGHVDFPFLVADRIQAVRGELPALGFSECLCLEVQHDCFPSSCYTLIFKNLNQTDIAQFNVSVCTVRKKERVSSSLTFQSEFTDRECMQTNNDQELPTFITLPSCRHTQLPSISNAQSLYAVHVFTVNQRAHRAEKCFPFKTETPEEFIKQQYEELRRLIQYQVKIGRMVFEDDGSTYRMTWKGATKFVIGYMWPLKQLRLAFLRRLSRKMMKLAGLD